MSLMAPYLMPDDMWTVTADEYSSNLIFSSFFSNLLQMSDARVFSGRMRMHLRPSTAKVPSGMIYMTDSIVCSKWMNSNRMIHFMHRFYRISGRRFFSLLSWKIERQVSIVQPAALRQRWGTSGSRRCTRILPFGIKLTKYSSIPFAQYSFIEISNLPTSTKSFTAKDKLFNPNPIMQSRKVLTLLIIHQGNKLLLGMKKRGFGAGRYNGFGGKIEKDETILEGAIRETVEEAGVRPTDAKQLGIIDFEFKGDPVLLEVHLFKATTFTGEVQQSEEMKPEWFETDKVPFERMWPDDSYWFPYMLQGKPFKAYFLFEGHDKILQHKIEETK